MSDIIIPTQISRRLPQFEAEYRGPAFRAIASIIKSYPYLAQNIKTWRLREGNPNEMQPATVNMFPMISMSPVALPSLRFSEAFAKLQGQINITVWVPGTCFEDISGVWEAVENAIAQLRPYQDGMTVGNYLCHILAGERGVMNLMATNPAFENVVYPDSKTPTNQGETPNSQRGVGSLTYNMLRPY